MTDYNVLLCSQNAATAKENDRLFSYIVIHGYVSLMSHSWEIHDSWAYEHIHAAYLYFIVIYNNWATKNISFSKYNTIQLSIYIAL